MGGDIKTMLEVARGELGYLEKKSNSQLDSKTANAGYNNFTKYGERLDQILGFEGRNGAFWCHSFVSWVAESAGCKSIIPYTAFCPEAVNWFRARKRFYLHKSYTPVAGDIIYFSTPDFTYGGGHVGIVTEVKNGKIYTIEGNTGSKSNEVIANGGGVYAKDYVLAQAMSTTNGIYGYGHPDYEEEEVFTYDQFKAYVAQLEKERDNKPIEDWALNAWKWSMITGIMDGSRPKGPASREELATVIYRYFNMNKTSRASLQISQNAIEVTPEKGDDPFSITLAETDGELQLTWPDGKTFKVVKP